MTNGIGPEREEAKRRILEEYPEFSKDALESFLSLPVERKIRKVTSERNANHNLEQTMTFLPVFPFFILILPYLNKTVKISEVSASSNCWHS